jgi:hypothetical protein
MTTVKPVYHWQVDAATHETEVSYYEAGFSGGGFALTLARRENNPMIRTTKPPKNKGIAKINWSPPIKVQAVGIAKAMTEINTPSPMAIAPMRRSR